jgi:hypothetical protein
LCDTGKRDGQLNRKCFTFVSGIGGPKFLARENIIRFSRMENANSIAFHGGEENETQLLLQRFKSALERFNCEDIF